MTSENRETFMGQYAEDFEIWSEFYDSSYEMDVLRKYADFSEEEVFEAGCGSGRLSFRIADRCGRLVSVDVLPSLINLCQQRLAENHSGLIDTLRFEVQDATSLPYPDDHFDAILDGWTFSVFEDREEAAAEYKRIVPDDSPFYAIQVRGGSEYQQILDKFIPDEKLERWTKGPSIDKEMVEYFGEPLVKEKIVTPYYFKSLDEAFEAYMFNFEEWLDMELPESKQQQLKKAISEYDNGDEIRIDEYAYFMKFSLSEKG
ncbi:hypothetical protein BRC84_01835 [Halobacteriales archaeon QS_1_68_44]|nr:MAG: hypothetical protein BRC84_01835 [Halobacteriales archaeon QS_1_68_44]